MTIGVLWEFFEFGMDEMFGLDMQKDTVMTGISSTLLDPSGLQHPQTYGTVSESVEVNGQELGVGGYLDIRAARYHGRPVRESSSEACVLGHRVPLPPKSGRGPVRADVSCPPRTASTMSKL